VRLIYLFNQQRNEAGWRFGLENDVLRRFSFKVAWLDLLKHFELSLIIRAAQNVEQGFGDQKSKLISKNLMVRQPIWKSEEETARHVIVPPNIAR
jgi:hypothetical protein